MAWREITTDDGIWKVEPAAERPAYAHTWHLVLSFRSPTPEHRPAKRFSATYPIEAESRNCLFMQADRIEEHELRALLAEHVSLSRTP